jgi:hypothetical protein
MVAVVTRGIGPTGIFPEWVKKYKVKYSNTASTWTTVPKSPNDVSFNNKIRH